jgi:hypothetical protein
MIFMLVPTESAEWEDMRLFTTYSSVEQVMKRGIEHRRIKNKHLEWCFVVQYDGTDELSPVFTYHITDTGDVIRTILSPSVS